MLNSVRLKVVFNYFSNIEISKMGEKPCERSKQATEWAKIGLGGNFSLKLLKLQHSFSNTIMIK